MAKEAPYTTVISHRSASQEQLYCGSGRGCQRRADRNLLALPFERMAKYNQLLRIEEELGDEAEFFGPMLAEYYALGDSED